MVWSDYKHVYHFSEGSGNFTNDSASNNSLFMWSDSEGGSRPLSFVDSEIAGKQLEFSADGCAISIYNTTGDLTGQNDRAIFVWEKKKGDASNGHGQVWALGYASSLKYFNLRHENTDGSGAWRLDYNTNRWTTSITADNLLNFQYIGMYYRKISWFINNQSLGRNNYDYDTLSAPIQVGGAWGISNPLTGCVANFNGFVDELRIANHTFASAYIRRTYQSFNASTYAFTENLSSLPDYSNESTEDEWDLDSPPFIEFAPASQSDSGSGGGSSGAGSGLSGSQTGVGKIENKSDIINLSRDNKSRADDSGINAPITGNALSDIQPGNNGLLYALLALSLMLVIFLFKFMKKKVDIGRRLNGADIFYS